MIVQSSRLVRIYKKWNKGGKKKRRERKSFAITFLDVFILKVNNSSRICTRVWRFCYTRGCIIEIVHRVKVVHSTEKFQIWDKWWTWDSRNTSFWIKNTIRILRKWCAVRVWNWGERIFENFRGVGYILKLELKNRKVKRYWNLKQFWESWEFLKF